MISVKITSTSSLDSGRYYTHIQHRETGKKYIRVEHFSDSGKSLSVRYLELSSKDRISDVVPNFISSLEDAYQIELKRVQRNKLIVKIVK